MKIAIEGCCHGELDKIYETLAYVEQRDNIKVDLLLICGDFQSVRNRADLQAMAVPKTYQKMNTFYKYYSGEKKAPVLTVFIGGNHEASNYLQELSYGGWVAPNIYYMGYAGILQFGGVRIGGISGIFKSRDYNKGHYEHPPYSEDTKRSCYHVRNLEVFRLKQLKKPIDIMLSHDWPRGIYEYGNTASLLKKKVFLREEVENGSLGSPPCEDLLQYLKPAYWFAAHLHVKFAAVMKHTTTDSSEEKITKFLSLDKCLPRRKFLQIIDLPQKTAGPLQLELDPEWLSVLKKTNHLLNLTKSIRFMPGPGGSDRWDFSVTDEDLKNLVDFGGIFKVPNNFEKTAAIHEENTPRKQDPPPQININPQTSLMCEMLSLTDPFAVFSGKQQPPHSNFDANIMVGDHGDDSLDVDDIDDEGLADDSDFIDSTMETTMDMTSNSAFETTANPDEISLDDLDNDEDDVGSLEEGPSSVIPDTAQDIIDPVRKLSDPEELVLDASLSSSNLDMSAISSFPLDSPTRSSNPSSNESSPNKRNTDNTDCITGVAAVGPSEPKKFKRRNQALYTSTDEDM